MDIVKTRKELDAWLAPRREQGKRIGLVPTMGALHAGHLSLLEYAKPLVDVVVCSIFVNPTQFNDPEDLAKYPRPIERDIKMLRQAKCDLLFMPEAGEMYPEGDPDWHLDLGQLDEILEAEHRPGHFQGVTQIVYKLFDAAKPDIACFGQKDFQQCMVIQHMVQALGLSVKLAICPTVREHDGLALSSRNVRLSDAGRKQALALVDTLQEAKARSRSMPLAQVVDEAIAKLDGSEGVRLEYFEVRDAVTLGEIHEVEAGQSAVALVAAWVEGVRLIDNMLLD